MNPFADIAKVAKSVENLRSAVTIGLDRGSLTIGTFRSFGFGPSALVFGGGSDALLESETEKVWVDNKLLFKTLTRVTVQNALLACIAQSPTDTLPSVEIVRSVFTGLENIPMRRYSVVARLHGGHLTKNPELTLGPFRIRVWDDSLIEELNLVIEASVLPFQKGLPVVILDTEAREPQRAKELADIHFRAFDNMFSFLIGRKLNTQFSAFGPKYDYVTERIASSGGNVSVMLERKDLITPVAIDEITEHYEPYGFNKIWLLHGKESLSEIEQRILKAIDWVGKANRDPDPADAFVQYVFAVEAMLTYQPRGVLLTPSVGSNIADSSAFIIGNNEAERREIVRRMNDLYTSRSAVAHGGSREITSEHLNDALALAWDLIGRLVLSPELAAVRTMKDLSEWVSTRKYS